MSTFDPFLIPIINQAIDFLFDEVKNILMERRTKRTHATTALDTNANAITKKTELRGLHIKKENLIGDEADELEHCIKQIKQHRKNRRMLEEEIGTYGGLTFAPIHLRNKLEITENETKIWSQKLKNIIEKIYNCEINFT